MQILKDNENLWSRSVWVKAILTRYSPSLDQVKKLYDDSEESRKEGALYFVSYFQ